jgi:hypothetical protein
VSAFSGVASMQKQFDRLQGNPDAYKIVMKNQVVRGLVIIGFSYFITLFLWPYVFSPLAEFLAGKLTPAAYVNLWVTGQIWTEWVTQTYFVDVITFLGLETIIVAVVQGLLLKQGNKPAQIRRTFGILTIIMFIITPFILTAIRAIPLMDWPDPHHWQGRTIGENIAAVFLSWVGGVNQGIFPWICMAFIGTMMGFDLLDKAVDQPFKKKWGLIGSWMILIGFGVQILVEIIASTLSGSEATLFTNGFGTIFGFAGPSSGYMLFAGGGEVLAMVLFLGQVEGKNRAKVFARRTVAIRRAGLIALTLYAIQFVFYIPIILLEYAFGLDPDQQQETIWQSLLMIAVCTVIAILVPWAWEKGKFKGTLEWFAAWILSKFTRRENTGDRLNTKGSLYEIEPLGEPGEIKT